MSTYQHFGFSSTSFEAIHLKLLIFIFLSLVVVLEHINLVLLNSAEGYQPHIINKSHKTSDDHVRAYTTLHYLAPKSYFKTW